MWWVFPTELLGASEPPPATAVSAATASELLHRAPPEWQMCLETVCKLVIEQAHVRGGPMSLRDVLPPIDHGRVKAFIKFWRDVKDTPDWLKIVLNILDAAAKGERWRDEMGASDGHDRTRHQSSTIADDMSKLAELPRAEGDNEFVVFDGQRHHRR